MTKFLAVVKHEYKKVVLKWSFLIGTLLLPLLAVGFAIVPAIIFSLKGDPTRIVVIDRDGSIEPRLKANLSSERMAARAREAAERSLKEIAPSQEEQLKRTSQQFTESFIFLPYDFSGMPPDEIRADLTAKILAGEIDAFLIIPANIEDPSSVFEFRSRRAGDIITNDAFRDALNSAVRSQRLAQANISEERVAELSRPIRFDAKGIDERGEDKDSTGIMIASLIIGLMIYITLAIYGQAILGAVVEEKETRIAEILFSSARPFELMMGKLVGVGLAGLTQLSIWVLSAAVLIAFLALQSDLAPLVASVPQISPVMILYFLIFFLLGFFTYAAIFALIGSMVTTVQEGGQFAFPPILLLLVGFYFSFAVMRDPGSSLAFWTSVAPFFAPIVMPVRILAQTPPIWEIGFAILINAAAIAGLVWLTSRVYRVGMLMYGKRATLPEVWKWIRHA
ncbi:MAG TPA: ABC transporter permease [Pyrinomonadaceae bacterium]|nr:ABC transporter permease [Pyrinomonadaceae bacterium]HMP65113.1 ABC transporter permease [Pyrinomonadaceae bacterium]